MFIFNGKTTRTFFETLCTLHSLKKPFGLPSSWGSEITYENRLINLFVPKALRTSGTDFLKPEANICVLQVYKDSINSLKAF